MLYTKINIRKKYIFNQKLLQTFLHATIDFAEKKQPVSLYIMSKLKADLIGMHIEGM